MARRLGWAALVTAATVLAGCGVPGHTDVRRDGPPQQRCEAPVGSAVVPPSAGNVTDPKALVERFLRTGAGGPREAEALLEEFLPAEAASSWKPAPELVVVRQLADIATPTRSDKGEYLVTVRVQPVGTLNDQGMLLEPEDSAQVTLSFHVAPRNANSGELVIKNPPPDMYLLTEALAGQPESVYQPYPIYFWDESGTRLVPDLRYLPRTGTLENRARALVSWVVKGPSPQLGDAVRGLPQDLGTAKEAVLCSEQIVVDLSGNALATPDLLPNLASQLTWTLRPVFDGAVVLTVASTTQYVLLGTKERPQDDPARLYASPALYCVEGGQVVSGCSRSGGGPAILSAKENAQVVAAAVTADQNHAALVRREAQGRYRLFVGRVRSENGDVAYLPSELSGGSLSRPTWLSSTSGPLGLIAVDGRLHMFTSLGAQGVQTTKLEIPGLSRIVAVSAAPDGHRIVLAANDGAYVAALVPKGGGVDVLSPRRLPTTALRGVSDVAWSRAERVLLLGNDGERPALSELTVDGAIETKGPRLEEGASHLSASPRPYPTNASDAGKPGPIVFERLNEAWKLDGFDGVPEPIPVTGPSPSPGTTTQAQPTIPFFQG